MNEDDYAQYRSNNTTLECLFEDDYYIHEIGKLDKKGKNSSFPVDDNCGKWSLHPLVV